MLSYLLDPSLALIP